MPGLSEEDPGTGARTDLRVLQALRTGALGGSLLVLAVALVVVVGWAADVEVLTRLGVGSTPVKLSAATCFGLVATVVLLELRRAPGPTADVLLGVVLVLALLRGSMSPATATCLGLLAVALLGLRRHAHRLAQSLAVVVVALSSVALLGYLYEVEDLYDQAFFTSLAVLSGVCLLVLALCVLCLDGEAWLMSWVTRDSPAGWAIRLLVPACYLAPVALAYLVVTGVREDWYSLPLGAALAVPVMTAVCVLLVGLVARRLHDSEQARREVLDSLAQAHDELGRRVEYAGIVAHDLRNPLAAILVYARMLEEQRTLADPERARRHAAQIVHVAETMGIILEDILSVAKLEAGTLQVDRGRLELVDFVDTLQLQAEVAYPDAVLRADVRVGELWVEADAVQLSRVLLNLLSNAVKYSPAGAPVELLLLREHDTALLKVVDHGHGIPAEDVPVLFEKFSRLPSGAKQEGSGLGLFICRSIVEAHEGEIWVEETPGGGATFCVSLAAVARRREPDFTASGRVPS